jgi:hypothetical protein
MLLAMAQQLTPEIVIKGIGAFGAVSGFFTAAAAFAAFTLREEPGDIANAGTIALAVSFLPGLLAAIAEIYGSLAGHPLLG